MAPLAEPCFVVKHTFLNLSEDFCFDDVACRRRACSDSAILENTSTEDAFSDNDKKEFEILGLSDDETDVEPKGCDDGTSSTDEETLSSGESQGADANYTDDDANNQLRKMQENLEIVENENARLSRENALLKKQSTMVSEGPLVHPSCGAIQSQPVLGQLPWCGHLTGMSVPLMVGQQQNMVACWFPASTGVSTQVACVAVPMVTNPALSRTHVSEQPSTSLRRAKRAARKAAATADVKPVASSPSDAILPDPVKPQADMICGKPRTTCMIRNMPNNYSRDMLLELLDSEGFAGEYDFVYLPMDFQSRACLGYTFVNLTNVDAVKRFWAKFDGYTNWAIPSRKVSGVSWSGHHQGFESHVERYRNSPVMSDTVPDEFKPVIFKNGERIPFPAPTRRIRGPRIC